MCENKKISNEIQQPVYFVGPLNLNRQTKKANTVIGTELFLDDKEFDVLYMLATREGEPLTFEFLYRTVWELCDDFCDRETARLKINNLSQKIKESGEGFMWIDYQPKIGYTFRIRWRINRQTQKESVVLHQNKKKTKKTQLWRIIKKIKKVKKIKKIKKTKKLKERNYKQ